MGADLVAMLRRGAGRWLALTGSHAAGAEVGQAETDALSELNC